VADYASMSGMTTLAGRPSIQLSDGSNLFSLLLFKGLESVRDESWSVASGSLTDRCTNRNSFEDSKIVCVSYIVGAFIICLKMLSCQSSILFTGVLQAVPQVCKIFSRAEFSP